MNERPRRVLVVDDDTDFREGVAAVLAGEGWEVREARDGTEALASLATFDATVVLLDWRMPGMDGGAVLERLALLPHRASVVLVTASPRGRELADRHRLPLLGKPFGIDDLLAVVADAHARE